MSSGCWYLLQIWIQVYLYQILFSYLTIWEYFDKDLTDLIWFDINPYSSKLYLLELGHHPSNPDPSNHSTNYLDSSSHFITNYLDRDLNYPPVTTTNQTCYLSPRFETSGPRPPLLVDWIPPLFFIESTGPRPAFWSSAPTPGRPGIYSYPSRVFGSLTSFSGPRPPLQVDRVPTPRHLLLESGLRILLGYHTMFYLLM